MINNETQIKKTYYSASLMNQVSQDIDEQDDELFEHYNYVADKGQEKLRN